MYCKNRVDQWVPSGWHGKNVSMPCGSTSIHGTPLYCDSCLERQEKQYPQGWRDVPGDLCKHGNYVGDAHGPDYMCGECEN